MNQTGAESPIEILAEDVALMNQPFVRGFFLVAYVAVFISCVFGKFNAFLRFIKSCFEGNSVILLVIITNRSMRTPTTFWLANLAIADLLVGIFCVFQNAAHFVLFEHGTWPFGEHLCHAYIYILHTIPNASAGILVPLPLYQLLYHI